MEIGSKLKELQEFNLCSGPIQNSKVPFGAMQHCSYWFNHGIFGYESMGRTKRSIVGSAGVGVVFCSWSGFKTRLLELGRGRDVWHPSLPLVILQAFWFIQSIYMLGIISETRDPDPTARVTNHVPNLYPQCFKPFLPLLAGSYQAPFPDVSMDRKKRNIWIQET